MMRLRLLCLLVGLVFATGSGDVNALRNDPAVASNIALLEKWIIAQMEARHLPGLAIAVVHDQDVVWSKGFGYADVEKRSAMTAQSVFRMASISKTFTCTAVMLLRDQGRLSLDDPVAKHLSWFKYKNRFPDGPKVTIRQLMSHTSGLPREAAFPYWTDHKFPSREEMIAAFQNQESVFEPETKLKYSNLGIAILGEVVAAVAGESYEEFVRKSILEPLGMTNSSVVPLPSQKGRFVTGYGRLFPDGTRQRSEQTDYKGLTPAAGISSTAEDMAKYAAFHLQETDSGKGALLKPSTLREMHRVQWLQPSWKSGWGLGFSVSKGEDRVTFGHGGWVAGNRSQLSVSPKENVAVVVLVNSDDGSPAMFSSRAMSMLAPAIAKAVQPRTIEPSVDSAWTRYVGLYTDSWGWDTEVLIFNKKLMMYGYSYPPEEDPVGELIELTPEGKDTFRLSGESGSGELVVFEFGLDGRVNRVKAEENYMYPKGTLNPKK